MNGTDLKFKITLTDGTETEQTVRIFNGLSAYEVWLADGNEGTLEDYLASLKGDPGDKGDTGPAGPVARVDGIDPQFGGNVILSRPSQIYLGGSTTTLTPVIKKLQNETLYIRAEGGGIVTVDLKNWVVSEMLPQFNLRLIFATNNTGTIRIKPPNTYMYWLDGSYTTPKDIAVGHNLQVYDIFNSVGSVPVIVKKYPQVY